MQSLVLPPLAMEQHDNSASNRAYGYTELAVSSLTMDVLTVTTHGGTTRLCRPGWLGTVTHMSRHTD